jgi:hypothetical protein
MKFSSNQSKGIAVPDWQDQFCEEIHIKFVTESVAFFSTVKNQKGSEVCMG